MKNLFKNLDKYGVGMEVIPGIDAVFVRFGKGEFVKTVAEFSVEYCRDDALMDIVETTLLLELDRFMGKYEYFYKPKMKESED